MERLFPMLEVIVRALISDAELPFCGCRSLDKQTALSELNNALRDAEPLYFNSRQQPYQALPYFIVMGSLRVYALAEQVGAAASCNHLVIHLLGESSSNWRTGRGS